MPRGLESVHCATQRTSANPVRFRLCSARSTHLFLIFANSMNSDEGTNKFSVDNASNIDVNGWLSFQDELFEYLKFLLNTKEKESVYKCSPDTTTRPQVASGKL